MKWTTLAQDPSSWPLPGKKVMFRGLAQITRGECLNLHTWRTREFISSLVRVKKIQYTLWIDRGKEWEEKDRDEEYTEFLLSPEIRGFKPTEWRNLAEDEVS